ncbi:glycerophosphodiester phosphodiesterase [Propionicimonas sp.]|uniref:glycerophosphodiester phosphodiesterase n=1 Tax=Propionicimonas sp. TaxID=1955623 RepID=UPI0018245F77|nr:glycerophosphodiester phosphodiesterase [Propionicimonas sp.]MBU3977314.1 glycerophosphodiester phosphodiesterase [Actinomycetota bacterium]MBA3021239.1 glycerophosphodiester phosphodiesterase [Propionicimonas sp.]MBU3985824.1 glycerophosphodiester phosphodiesterase [Actinomycetota bacterium]MBU4008609.1 glycerophosphodiester phosphodiesterase [Actinomycetota bacterium]MBU4066241.1 glycerophosphodiester phosphodiesterase [Actinomycetota bacterium]
MRDSQHPYLGTNFVAMAHRGGWLSLEDRARENTWYAFAQAVAEGYRHLETDVHTTADGTLVAFHDSQLGRLTDASGQLNKHNWAELADVRVGGSDPISPLEELLAEFSSTYFNIDLKDDAAVTALPVLLAKLGAEDRVCVASFSTLRLRRFRALAPNVLTATTPAEIAWYAFGVGLRRRPLGAGAVLQVPTRVFGDRIPLVRPDVLAAAHAAGRKVHVWTVDERAEMERLIDLGVDGIITNEIGILKQVLTERGLWEGQE